MLCHGIDSLFISFFLSFSLSRSLNVVTKYLVIGTENHATADLLTSLAPSSLFLPTPKLPVFWTVSILSRSSFLSFSPLSSLKTFLHSSYYYGYNLNPHLQQLLPSSNEVLVFFLYLFQFSLSSIYCLLNNYICYVSKRELSLQLSINRWMFTPVLHWKLGAPFIRSCATSKQKLRKLLHWKLSDTSWFIFNRYQVTSSLWKKIEH